MREIKLAPEPHAVTCFIIRREEERINIIERWGGMLALSKDRATVDIMEENVELIGLIWVAAVVEEHVRSTFAFRLRGYSDGLGCRGSGSKRKHRWATWRDRDTSVRNDAEQAWGNRDSRMDYKD